MKNKKVGMYEKYVKRFLDVVFSLIAIILTLPVMLVIAILVRIKLGTPVIFRQERPGLNEKIFMLYKFRTMTDKVDENGNLYSDDIRLTKFGKLLRATSLDELPELFNIIKGDMSFVGPRPLLVRYLPYYTEEERKRHSVRPGLTGLAQIKGRNMLSWSERFALDCEYVNSINVKNDMIICIKTVKKVFKSKDIATDGKYIMQDLDKERRDGN